MPRSLYLSSRFTLLIWLAVTLSTSGCLFKKSPRTYTPPPIPPQTAKPAPPPPPPFVNSPPSQEELSVTVESPEIVAELPSFPEAPKPAPPRPRPPAPKPTPQPPPAAVETVPPPRITQMFPPEQARAYNKELDETLGRVAKALETLGKKNLTPEEGDKAEQIRTFQKQAVQAREQDLVNAVNLARRADLLAQNLLERLP